MHTDFHLYGTYLAARFAGFERDEAEQIAFAAQCVDDFCSGEYGSVKELQNTASAGLLKKNEIIQMTWTLFHFLPSFPENYFNQFNGELIDEAAFATAPNSYLSNLMINTLVAAFNDRDPIIERATTRKQKLAMTGVVMHVLADTYAHEGFSGISAQRNIVAALKAYSAGEVVEGTPSHVPVSVAEIFRFLNLDLGHGAAGHLPDVSWARYSYTRENNLVTRDNAEIFMAAFKKMVFVLLAIKHEVMSEECVQKIDAINRELNIYVMRMRGDYAGNLDLIEEKNDIFFETFVGLAGELFNTVEMDVEDMKRRYNTYKEAVEPKRGGFINFFKSMLPNSESRKFDEQPMDNDFFFATVWYRSNMVLPIYQLAPEFPSRKSKTRDQ